MIYGGGLSSTQGLLYGGQAVGSPAEVRLSGLPVGGTLRRVGGAVLGVVDRAEARTAAIEPATVRSHPPKAISPGLSIRAPLGRWAVAAPCRIFGRESGVVWVSIGQEAGGVWLNVVVAWAGVCGAGRR
jgi:hypothetical protein